MTSEPAYTPLTWRAAALDRPSAIALGNFDGVHLGHRRILEALRARAEAEGLEPVALTFEPHPRQFLFPDARTSLLTSPREKAARMAELGITVVTLVFDADLAALSAEAFATDVLMGRLRGTCFFLGSDHRFGKGARGDAALLRSLATGSTQGNGKHGMDCVTEIAPAFESGELVSSSGIRHHLKTGNIARANILLGRPYSLRGTVGPGDGRGRQLGYPTANLQIEDPRKILPFGVFGGTVVVDGTPRSAVANIGLRPTFKEGNPEPAVEIHLLDWTGDLYGKTLDFEVLHFLRPEQRFDGIESLKRQIAIDIEKWRKIGISGSF
jgi:riboflavin kinase/FMN adenylyltransferase